MATRLERLEKERPGLYATRHVARGVGRVVVALIGTGLLLGLLPAIGNPIDLPDINITIQPPEPPAWIVAVTNSAVLWLPILIGIVIAVREWRGRGAA